MAVPLSSRVSSHNPKAQAERANRPAILNRSTSDCPTSPNHAAVHVRLSMRLCPQEGGVEEHYMKRAVASFHPSLPTTRAPTGGRHRRPRRPRGFTSKLRLHQLHGRVPTRTRRRSRDSPARPKENNAGVGTVRPSFQALLLLFNKHPVCLYNCLYST